MKTEQFVIESDPKNLKALREQVGAFLSQTGLPEKSKNDFQIAIGEACTNSIRHAYMNETGHKVEVTAEDDGERVTFRIRDYGKKIDLSKVKEPKLPKEDPGGLGIYFMKTMMDEMTYNTDHPRGNELILVKYKKIKRGTS